MIIGALFLPPFSLCCCCEWGIEWEPLSLAMVNLGKQQHNYAGRTGFQSGLGNARLGFVSRSIRRSLPFATDNSQTNNAE